MANYITCKDTRSFAYAETTNKGYYEVLSVSEDGKTCHVKTVWHENKNYIGREYDIPVERAAEDFTAVEEMIVVSVLERQALSLTGWITEATSHFTRQDVVSEHCYDCTGTNFNIWNSDAWRQTRMFMYVPDETSVDMPRTNIYGNNFERRSSSDIAAVISNAFSKSYEYVESFVIVPDDNFDATVEAAIQDLPTEWRTTIPFPDELKMNLRSINHKVVVIRHEKKFAYITNVKSDQIFFNTAPFFAEQIGKPMSEDAKAALLRRDKEAYYTDIFKNIDAVINGMHERAKVKMFTDFNDKFNGMLVEPLRQAVEAARREYESYCRTVSDSFVRLQDANARLFYAEHGIENGENEFISFINDARANVVSINADPSDNRITFCIRTFLTYWDDDLWDIVRKSDDRFRRLTNWRKLLLDEIFKDRTVKLLIEQKFFLDTYRGDAVRETRYRNEPYGEGTQGLRNPHIHRYDCWGTHKTHIRDAMQRGDYVQAYSQAVACISGLTLSDSPVMNEFFGYITGSDYENLPCLYIVESGTYISMKQYKQLVEGKKWEA